MKLKILLLTIVVSFLSVLSVFIVLQDSKNQGKMDSILNQTSQAYLGYSEKDILNKAAFILPVAESNYLPFRDWNILEPDVGVKAGAVFDTHSGKFLFQKNLKTKLPIASITKLLTAAVIIENIELDSIVFIPQEAMNVDHEGGEDFFLNESFFARDLLRAMLIKSSNDAAVAFQIFAKEKGMDLIELINKKSADIGMVNSKFYDPAGLDDRGYSTAEDLVKLVGYIKRYPEVENILITKNVKIRSVDGRFEHELDSTDKLLGVIPDIEAGKTGNTDEALGTMILRINLPGYDSSLIGVILGSNDRFSDMKKIIEWAKIAYRWK